MQVAAAWMSHKIFVVLSVMVEHLNLIVTWTTINQAGRLDSSFLPLFLHSLSTVDKSISGWCRERKWHWCMFIHHKSIMTAAAAAAQYFFFQNMYVEFMSNQYSCFDDHKEMILIESSSMMMMISEQRISHVRSCSSWRESRSKWLLQSHKYKTIIDVFKGERWGS